MFYAALCWPEMHDKKLWPLAMSHAVHLHNNTPHHMDGLTPMEIWSSSQSMGTQLQNAHPWGCPVCVLDPRLQDGSNIPRWDPHTRCVIFMGVSPLHASSVGVICNPAMNCLSPQFHCICDDYFETIGFDSLLEPPQWQDLVIGSGFHNDLETDAGNTSYIDT